MKILVTGGAGYIGSVVAHELVRHGDDVIVLDNLSQGHRRAVPEDATFIHGDLADRPLLDRVMAQHRPQAIMHFASNTLVGESVEKPFLYLGDNLTNGLNLLQSAVEHGVRRFILSSTANLFDDPAEMPIKADERIVPGSPYGESKFLLERLLHWMGRIYGMHYAALRYFNAAGAASPDLGEAHLPENHIIPLVFQAALGQRKEITIFGDDYPTPDGTCVRDYIHVLDLAQAHILALRALGEGSRVYNLGNGQGFSVKELIETARRITRRNIPAVVGARRPGDPAILIADSRKIKADLGWEPRYPRLEDILTSAWAWHLKHPLGYED